MRNLIISGRILFALFIASPNFIFPKFGSWVYIIFLFLYEGFYFQTQQSHRRTMVKTSKSEEWEYSPEETDLMKEYPTFFFFTLNSRGISAKMATIQFLTFIIVPWLLFKGMWFHALIIGLNYFVATNLAVVFNPQFYMQDFIDNIDVKKKRGKLHLSQRDSSLCHKYSRELNIINGILSKKYTSIKEP